MLQMLKNLLKNVKKYGMIWKNVRQDLDADCATVVEDATDAEELTKECEEIWNDLEECQSKLSLVGTETFTDSSAQLLLVMPVKCLTIGVSQWQKETPELIPLTEDVLVTVEKEEFQNLRHDLEWYCLLFKKLKVKGGLRHVTTIVGGKTRNTEIS
ncbi:Centromere protein K [Camelus dromedarius]|uniref:Centromere protein K n=1 Tax=Camelus dromedarius TaxID=9838 RepID=A0A5N4CE47_CAMDR|nr:Centromere protein K [Camelus dromedarius]